MKPSTGISLMVRWLRMRFRMHDELGLLVRVSILRRAESMSKSRFCIEVCSVRDFAKITDGRSGDRENYVVWWESPETVAAIAGALQPYRRVLSRPMRLVFDGNDELIHSEAIGLL